MVLTKHQIDLYLQSLKQIAAYLKVGAGKIYINNESMVTREYSKTKTVGYFNITLQLIKESKKHYLYDYSDLEKAQVRQWIDYALVYITQCDTIQLLCQFLKELNQYLQPRTYIVRNTLSMADIVLFYIIQSSMEILTIRHKDEFINVSRWYDNLQQEKEILQASKRINFKTNYLAPALH